MAKLKIRRRTTVKKPVSQVINELKLEGWPLIADNGDRAFFYRSRDIAARALRYASN